MIATTTSRVVEKPTPSASPDLVPLVGRRRTLVIKPPWYYRTLSIACSIGGAGSAKPALVHGKFEAMIDVDRYATSPNDSIERGHASLGGEIHARVIRK